MSFISRIKANKKLVIAIITIFIFLFITLCIICYNLYIKYDKLTNPNYFPPEVETLFLTEINISESEVLTTELIKIVLKDVSEKKLDIPTDSWRPFIDYESMPNSLKLLIEECIDGFIIRKDHKVSREELMTDLRFYVTEHFVALDFRYSSIGYTYTYYPDGAIRKELACGFTKSIEKIYHFIDNDEIGVLKFDNSSRYSMINDGELIRKNHTHASGRRSYANSYYKLSLQDYNLFRSDYMEGYVPNDFILTIKNIYKYLDKEYPYDDSEYNVDFGVSNAGQKEFTLYLRLGLVPDMEVYTLEYIAEYIKNKHTVYTIFSIVVLFLITLRVLYRKYRDK